MTTDPSVAIVGAGVGGLAAALYLRSAGVAATAYEQSAEITAAGAGIIVTPNAVRLMRRPGPAEPFAERAVRLEQAWEFRRREDGRVLFVQEMGDARVQMFGESMYAAHRGDLIGAFARAVPPDMLRLSCPVTGVTDHGDAVEVRAGSPYGPRVRTYDAEAAADATA